MIKVLIEDISKAARPAQAPALSLSSYPSSRPSWSADPVLFPPGEYAYLEIKEDETHIYFEIPRDYGLHCIFLTLAYTPPDTLARFFRHAFTQISEDTSCKMSHEQIVATEVGERICTVVIFKVSLRGMNFNFWYSVGIV